MRLFLILILIYFPSFADEELDKIDFFKELEESFPVSDSSQIKIETLKEVKQKKGLKINQSSNFKNTAILQGLNKITAKITTLKVPVFSTAKFGNLIITVSSCWNSPADQKPENKILLEIKDKKPDENEGQQIFHGWMLSSSPAISALEHPVYDIVALKCINIKRDKD